MNVVGGERSGTEVDSELERSGGFGGMLGEEGRPQGKQWLEAKWRVMEKVFDSRQTKNPYPYSVLRIRT